MRLRSRDYSLISLGEEVRLDKPAKVADYPLPAFEENPMQEAFYCVYLDRKNHPLGRHLITVGTSTNTVIAPKEYFRGAILSGGTAIVVAHNHHSGDPGPSRADITVTRALREAAKILDIELMDHVIVGDAKFDPQGRGYFSVKGAGHLLDLASFAPGVSRELFCTKDFLNYTVYLITRHATRSAG